MTTRSTSSKGKRAVGYIRVSSVRGREGDSFLSPDLQREKIEAWAGFRGFTVTGWYVDLDVSGTGKVRRPEFERMMTDARARKFDAVAVYKLTRFARSMTAASNALAKLDEHGVGLVSVTEDGIDTTTASGKLMRNVFLSFAQFEAERIGEEWRAVHANRRRRGLANVTRHVTGYRQNGTAELAQVEPVEAQAVHKMYEMRAAGRSYRQIRDALQAEGFVTRLGHSRFNVGVIGQILTNPIYSGQLLGPDGELLPGKHEPLVPRDLWERVQKLSRQATRNNRYRGSLLSGFLVCASCGYRMQFAAETVRSNGYLRRAAYRCSANSRSEPCPHAASIQADIVDDYIEREFLHRFDRARMPHGGKLKAIRQQREWQTRLSKLQGRLDALDRALDQLADQRFVKGTMDAREYERQSGRYVGERTALEDHVAELERTIETVRPLEQNVLDLWDGLAVAVKRQAFRISIGQVRVRPAARRGKGKAAIIGDRLDIGWLQ